MQYRQPTDYNNNNNNNIIIIIIIIIDLLKRTIH